MLNFKRWLIETCGEDSTHFNSESPGWGKSRFVADGYPRDPKDKDNSKKDVRMGFMRAKMRKKMTK